jgi:hypothetical protein
VRVDDVAAGVGRRDVLTAVGVCACGLAWVAQLFLPWAAAGLLSTSSGADVWRLAQDDLLPADLGRVVPALAVLPVLGVVVLATAGSSRRRPRIVRLGLVGLGLVVGLVLAAAIGSRVDGPGPGLVLTVAASVLAAAVVVGEVVGLRRPAPAGSLVEVE